LAKLDGRQLEAFLAAPPPACRVVLLYGDDPGLVRERGDRIIQSVSEGDPFRIVDIPKESSRDAGLLRAEASTFSLMGGRRAIRVRDTGDSFAAAAKEALTGSGPGVVILEAAELPARSKLRSLAEASPAAAVIPCWQERGAALTRAVRGMLAEFAVAADDDAVASIAGQFGADRQTLRRECEKLALYAGRGGRLGLADVFACSEGHGAADADDAVAAVFGGDIQGGERRIDAALADGTAAGQLLRAAAWQAQRLLQATLAMAEGADAADAVGRLRPPVFFKQRPAMEHAARLWTPNTLMRLIGELLLCEHRTRLSTASDEALVRQILLRIARAAATAR